MSGIGGELPTDEQGEGLAPVAKRVDSVVEVSMELVCPYEGREASTIPTRRGAPCATRGSGSSLQQRGHTRGDSWEFFPPGVRCPAPGRWAAWSPYLPYRV